MTHPLPRRFEGKVAVVTGGASGMGEATARRLAAEGCAVVIGDVNSADGERVSAQIVNDGGRAVFQHTDVTDEQSVHGMITRALAEYGRLDAAAHIAGIAQQPKSFLDNDEPLWRRMEAVNVRGTYLVLRAAAAHLVTTGGGAIISLSSLAGIRPQPHSAYYSATKHAAVGLITSAAGELIARNVRINGIAPGAIDTPMMVGQPAEAIEAIVQAQPMKRLGRSPEIAAVAAFLLSDDASFIVGQILIADGGWADAS